MAILTKLAKLHVNFLSVNTSRRNRSKLGQEMLCCVRNAAFFKLFGCGNFSAFLKRHRDAYRVLSLTAVGVLILFSVSNQAQAADDGDTVLFFVPAIISGTNGEVPPSGPLCPVRPLDNSADFEEQFYKFSASRWSAYESIPRLNSSTGSPVCPSLEVSGGYVMTNQSWSIAGGMDIYLRIKIKYSDLTCYPGLPTIGYTGFHIVNLSGHSLAGIRFLEPVCPNSDEVTLDYYGSGWFNDHTGDSIVWPPYNGQFMEFRIRISADGYVKWYRDGFLKYVSLFPISTEQPVRLKLREDSGKIQLYFDDIRIYR